MTLRQFKPSPNRRLIDSSGTSFIDFLTIDYLGLSFHSSILELFSNGGLQPYFSPIFFLTPKAEAVERKIAEYTGFESVALFPSVTLLHAGVLPAAVKFYDRTYFNSFSHASLKKPLKSVGNAHSYASYASLERLVVDDRHQKFLVATDSVHGMSTHQDIGFNDFSIKIHDLGGSLYVDDSHGFGVLGCCGEGVSRSLSENDMYVGSLSKSMSVPLAFLASSEKSIKFVKSRVSEYGFSGSVPDHIIEAGLIALDISASTQGHDLRYKLDLLTSRLTSGLSQSGWDSSRTEAGGVVLYVESKDEMINLFNTLEMNNVAACPVAYPATERNRWGARFSVSASHSFDDVDVLLNALN